MGLAIALIIFKGSASEGQISFFNSFLTNYVEETAASIITSDSSQNQLADINSVFAYSGSPDKMPKVSILSMIQDNSVVSRGTILTDIIDQFSDRGNEITTYEVQEGDTLSFIASDYGVSVNTLIWANNLKSADDIQPGMELKIPPVTGVVHLVKKGDTIGSIAKKYGVDEDKIISFNSLPKDGSLQEGEELIVPDGKLAQPKSAPSQSTITTRFAYLPNINSFFMLPAIGYNWGRLHGRNGVDVANSCGTPVVAAADGIVNLARPTDPLGRTGRNMNGGFGKFIRITHNNGTETLYAHASKLLVEIGDFVKQGQEIALIGTTGNSTGCHLHFEVHGAKNPLAKY